LHNRFISETLVHTQWLSVVSAAAVRTRSSLQAPWWASWWR